MRKTGFIVRRGLKIWPAYFAFVAYFTVARSIEDGVWTAWHPTRILTIARAIAPNLLHVQNYFPTLTPRTHTWTLAVEEHFYLLLPLVLGLLVLRGKANSTSIRAMPWITILLCLVCTTMRYLAELHGPPWYKLRCPTHLRVDGLFVGVCIAYLHHYRPSLLALAGRHRWVLAGLGCLLICPFYVPLDLPGGAVLRSVWAGSALLYLGFGLILIALLYTGPDSGWAGRIVHGRLGRAVAFVGVYSYSIYLWHPDLGSGVVRVMWDRGVLSGIGDVPRWLAATGVYLVLSIGTGVLLAKIIEIPGLRIRDRLFPARAAALPQPDASEQGTPSESLPNCAEASPAD